jgi:hypothetical protein
VSGARTGDLFAAIRVVSPGVRLASDLLEELAACELVVVGEDGGADEYALQDLVVVESGQARDAGGVGRGLCMPGVEGQPFAGRFRPDVRGGQVDPVPG